VAGGVIEDVGHCLDDAAADNAFRQVAHRDRAEQIPPIIMDIGWKPPHTPSVEKIRTPM
jgi:hypothetical protein